MNRAGGPLPEAERLEVVDVLRGFAAYPALARVLAKRIENYVRSAWLLALLGRRW